MRHKKDEAIELKVWLIYHNFLLFGAGDDHCLSWSKTHLKELIRERNE